MKTIVAAAVSLLLSVAAAHAVKPTDWGYEAGRGKVDMNGDGYVDYCRVVGTQYPSTFALCSLSTGSNPEQLYAGSDIRSNPIDWGYNAGRAWVDFNGDGKADYCRIVGGDTSGYHAKCLLSTGTGFGPDVMSVALDAGYEDSRVWKDVNGDAKVDYCRLVGMHREIVRCTLSAGNSFGQEVDDLAK